MGEEGNLLIGEGEGISCIDFIVIAGEVRGRRQKVCRRYRQLRPRRCRRGLRRAVSQPCCVYVLVNEKDTICEDIISQDETQDNNTCTA